MSHRSRQSGKWPRVISGQDLAPLTGHETGFLHDHLGLFGLASFVAERRTKEIGIRKILGATVVHLWQKLSTEFILLVTVSCFIAAPVSYYILQKGLQGYEYKTDIGIWIFVSAALGALIITLVTVSFQAIRAALANPVKSLRSE